MRYLPDSKTVKCRERLSGRPDIRRIISYCAVIFAISCVAVVAISAYVCWDLTHPKHEPIDGFPTDYGLNYQQVSFKSKVDSLVLKGWLIKAAENKQTVIFAHGYGKNRLQSDVPLLPLAQVLVRNGINVLMFDFRNSGESDGEITSVGQFEVRDLAGAVEFIKQHQELNQKISLFGFSMGASVALIVGAQEPAVSAVIADSPFADLTTYLEENLAVWTKLPAFPFNHTVFAIIPAVTGLNAGSVSPVKQDFADKPVLLIHGEADTDIPIENSELLLKTYRQARMVRIPGAQHVKAFQTDGERYIKEILNFLEI